MMKKFFDYLIVGAGLFGSVCAHELNKKGKKCLVIDKRNYRGGNISCEEIEGIQVHRHGPHIFHTNDIRIWKYVNQFAPFNNFIYSPLANFNGDLYNLPFNMNTFYQLWGISSPEEAKRKIETECAPYRKIENPRNLEDQALSMVGRDIYEKLIKGYSEKQWGRAAREIPAGIITRLPVRFTFDNNYYNHTYQGIPTGGYNKLIDGLLEGIEVRLNTDYFKEKSQFDSLARKTIFTGRIDGFFDFCFGKLEYRSLRFDTKILNTNNFQGVAGVNYTGWDVPFTRSIEHKHFEFGTQDKSVVTWEYPCPCESENEPYYPLNDKSNQEKYLTYHHLSEQIPNLFFGGRLGEYRYYDMDKVIASALNLSGRETQV